MRLFISLEGQNCIENGLSDILTYVRNKLEFITGGNSELECVDNYGTEFRVIAIIPTCVENKTWESLGWKERKQVSLKKQEADIRLKMDYERFVSEKPENKRLMFVDIIIKSIQVVNERSKKDFYGNRLIVDVLTALNVTQDQLDVLNHKKMSAN